MYSFPDSRASQPARVQKKVQRSWCLIFYTAIQNFWSPLYDSSFRGLVCSLNGLHKILTLIFFPISPMLITRREISGPRNPSWSHWVHGSTHNQRKHPDPKTAFVIKHSREYRAGGSSLPGCHEYPRGSELRLGYSATFISRFPPRHHLLVVLRYWWFRHSIQSWHSTRRAHLHRS